MFKYIQYNSFSSNSIRWNEILIDILPIESIYLNVNLNYANENNR